LQSPALLFSAVVQFEPALGFKANYLLYGIVEPPPALAAFSKRKSVCAEISFLPLYFPWLVRITKFLVFSN